MEQTIQKLLEITSGEIKNKASSYSPLALAYIGDGVYELFIRSYILNKGNAPVNKYHKTAKELVRASSQSKIYHLIEECLTDTERAVLRRGRNAKSISAPKNGDVTEYRHATGLEALIGFLYIDGQIDRIKELIDLGLNKLTF